MHTEWTADSYLSYDRQANRLQNTIFSSDTTTVVFDEQDVICVAAHSIGNNSAHGFKGKPTSYVVHLQNPGHKLQGDWNTTLVSMACFPMILLAT